MPIVVIDPATLNPEDIEPLLDFFEMSEKKENNLEWDSFQTYPFKDEISYRFKYEVVKRQNDKGTVHYDFFSRESFGDATAGGRRVKKVLFSLIVKKEEYKWHKPDKKKGYKWRESNEKEGYKWRDPNKYELLIKSQPSAGKKDYGLIEYDKARLTEHLKVKKPTTVKYEDVKRITYMVMRKMPGQSLSSILEKNIPLSPMQRLQLSLGILRALKSQVTDKNLVHKDIKPANIIVNLYDFIEVNIIDYGLAKENNSQLTPSGTVGYRAHEVMSADDPDYAKGKKITIKADVFSAAAVLYRLFETAELSDDIQEQLDNLLLNMLAVNVDKRLSIEQAILRLEQIIRKYQADNIQHVLRSLQPLQDKAVELRARGNQNEADKLDELSNKIKGPLDELKQMDPWDHDYPSKVEEYASSLNTVIEAAKPDFQKHRNVNYILANIGLAILGLGVIYGLSVLVNYKKTGQLGFFTQTKTDKLVDDVRNDLDEWHAQNKPQKG